MFKNEWEQRRVQSKVALKAISSSLVKIDKETTQLVDNIIRALSQNVIKAYQTRIKNLEREELILMEKREMSGNPRRTYVEMFEMFRRKKFYCNNDRHLSSE